MANRDQQSQWLPLQNDQYQLGIFSPAAASSGQLAIVTTSLPFYIQRSTSYTHVHVPVPLTTAEQQQLQSDTRQYQQFPSHVPPYYSTVVSNYEQLQVATSEHSITDEVDQTFVNNFLASFDYPKKDQAIPYVLPAQQSVQRLSTTADSTMDPELASLIDSFAVCTVDSNQQLSHNHVQQLNTVYSVPFSSHAPQTSPQHRSLLTPEQAHLPPPPTTSMKSITTTTSPIRWPCAHLEQALVKSVCSSAGSSMQVVNVHPSSGQAQVSQLSSYSHPTFVYSSSTITSVSCNQFSSLQQHSVVCSYSSPPSIMPPPLTHEPQRLSIGATTPLTHLTEESLYLSRPYHIGVPVDKDTSHTSNVSSDHDSHDSSSHLQQLSFPVATHTLASHQVMCPVHKRVFDSSLYGLCTDLYKSSHRHHLYHAGSTTAVSNSSQDNSSIPLVFDQHAPGSVSGSSTSVSSSDSVIVLSPSASPSSESSQLQTTPQSTPSSSTVPIPWPHPPTPPSVTMASGRSSSKNRTAGAESTMKEIDPKEKAFQFAKNFRQKRLQLDFTPEGVAQQVNIRFGSTVNPPLCGQIISMFEDGLLHIEEMFRLKNYLENWLVDIERARGVPLEKAKELAQSAVHKRDRKKRAFIDGYQRYKLEIEFQKNNRPNRMQLKEIARSLGSAILDYETVRIWFCNRRNKQKLETEDSNSSTCEALEDYGGGYKEEVQVLPSSPSNSTTADVSTHSGNIEH